MTPRELFLAAARGESTDRPPVWMMRQAGRYLPEYQAAGAGRSFESRMSDPALAAEITLQPLRRFPVDAAVLFSDIVVPLAGMGRPARIGPHGPEIAEPVRSPRDVETLRIADPSKADFVAAAIERVRREIPDRALLGFAGAPFTLACYLIEGGSSKGFAETKRFCYQHPEAWRALMDVTTESVVQHLRAQAAAGCDALQLFDTWAEALSASEYERLALPYTQRVFRALRDEGAPTIFFARGSAHLLPLLPKVGSDVLSIDWRLPLRDARRAMPGHALQGNLDPTLLFAPRDEVAARTRAMIDEVGGRALVANLGHGILPGTPVEGVAAFVEAVVGWSS